MAEICAFRGIRYNPAVVGDLNRVVSPPYDVIGAQLQDELYRRSPYNMVRLDLGKVLPRDEAEQNRYSRSRALFSEWLGAGVLLQDGKPALYYLEEDYRDDARHLRTRKGFIASVRIEDAESGLYRPHEKTLAKPKEDRIQLTRACRANLSPIFSLYDDPEMAVAPALERVASQRAPLLRVTDDGGVETRLWRIDDAASVETVARGITGKGFFIADGHHRYETALAHRQWMREQCSGTTGTEPWNYVMMYLSNMRDPGLTIFPTHRAVFGLEGLDVEAFLRRCERHFRVESVNDGDGLLESVSQGAEGQHRFGVCAKGTPGGWVLTLHADASLRDLLGAGLSAVLHDLDVTILHSLLLERLLEVGEEAQAKQRNLLYVKGGEELLRIVAEDPEVQLGFVLNPTRIDQVKAVAESGQRMPQKSTFFYPKLVTGLVIRPLFRNLEELSNR